MNRALVSLAWVVGCALGVAPAQQVTAPAEVAFGAAFEVVVEAEGAFDVAALAPLEVEVVARERAGGRERLRLRARCYELGAVTLAVTPPVTLQVASSLPTPPGELEWPRDGYARAFSAPPRWLIALGTAGVIIGVYLGWRRLARPTVSAASEPPPIWDAAAALRALEVAGADAEQALLQVKAILRRYCAERFGVPAEVRTSEELLLALPGGHETLRPCLQDIDFALFGELPAADDGPARSRDRALVFVAEVEGGR